MPRRMKSSRPASVMLSPGDWCRNRATPQVAIGYEILGALAACRILDKGKTKEKEEIPTEASNLGARLAEQLLL